MKKIMFNDRYGLTKAVLEGRKTMTRRIVNFDRVPTLIPGRIAECCLKYAPFKPGEVVAVAQSYRDIEKEINRDGLPLSLKDSTLKSPGYRNKMFVLAEDMPHRIRITGVRVERLQDISDEDCLKEGIHLSSALGAYVVPLAGNHLWRAGNSPREAFANLIRSVSGRKAWEDNPWVYVYEFELVK